jgi:hypothetical protein
MLALYFVASSTSRVASTATYGGSIQRSTSDAATNDDVIPSAQKVADTNAEQPDVSKFLFNLVFEVPRKTYSGTVIRSGEVCPYELHSVVVREETLQGTKWLIQTGPTLVSSDVLAINAHNPIATTPLTLYGTNANGNTFEFEVQKVVLGECTFLLYDTTASEWLGNVASIVSRMHSPPN